MPTGAGSFRDREADWETPDPYTFNFRFSSDEMGVINTASYNLGMSSHQMLRKILVEGVKELIGYDVMQIREIEKELKAAKKVEGGI